MKAAKNNKRTIRVARPNSLFRYIIKTVFKQKSIVLT